ncbi:MAG: hypothetical protein JWQ09_923 [Segetibacter sp.]|nr:hypothetical protein [Segetibacter sp.]
MREDLFQTISVNTTTDLIVLSECPEIYIEGLA